MAKLGNAEAACTSAPYVKKFAPVQAALLMFGKKASKSACVNHAPMPSPLVPGDGAVVGLLCAGVDALEEDVDAGGAVVDDAPVEEDVDEGGAVVDSPPEQPAAFQIDSALQ